MTPLLALAPGMPMRTTTELEHAECAMGLNLKIQTRERLADVLDAAAHAKTATENPAGTCRLPG